jgi:hypothetical protein
MKQILLMMLLVSSIHAKITQKDLCQFQKVIQNGWSEDNRTLNQKIINLGNTEVARIIEKLKYPLKSDENSTSIPPFPQVLINRDDYVKLFAYSKYLESQNKTTELLSIYIKAYQGIYNIEMSSFFPYVFLIALNLEINKSFDSSLRHHIFTKKEKRLLYEKLSSILILNTDKLIETTKAEKNITLYFINNSSKVDGDYAIDKQHLKIFKKLWRKLANKYYSKFISAIKSNTIEKFIEEKKNNRESISISTHLQMKLLKLKLKLYNKLSITINKKDYITLSTYTINQDLHMHTKSIDTTIRNYFKLIQENLKLLQLLQQLKEIK